MCACAYAHGLQEKQRERSGSSCSEAGLWQVHLPVLSLPVDEGSIQEVTSLIFLIKLFYFEIIVTSCADKK